MTVLLSPIAAATHIAIFTALMVIATLVGNRGIGTRSLEGFLVVDRRVPWWLGGPSITASWTWAVALLISVQMAYQQGFAGFFWFTVPNVIAVLIFVWLGPRIRTVLPMGYSLPEWMYYRFKSKPVTYLYLFVYFYYQVMATVVQIYAGAHILSAATGISAATLMPTVLIATWTYALISGMEASVITDFLQTAMMIFFGWIIVAMAVSAAGGHMSFTGIGGSGSLNPFSPKIALTTGIISSIGLISGSIGDQQFWQRCLSIKEGDLKKSFLFGAILFASIPISLSLLGFTAASPSVQLNLPASVDPSLVGFAVVRHLLPSAIATLYLYVVLAGLCSTLDSALSASSSLYPLVYAKPWNSDSSKRPQPSIGQARMVMIVVGVIGLLIGYMVELIPGFGLKYLWWFLNTIGACVVVPTVLSLFWKGLAARGILWGSCIGLSIGLPLVVYGSVAQNDVLLAATYTGIIILSTGCCLLLRQRDRLQDNRGGPE